MLQALNIFQTIKTWVENVNTALTILLILSMDGCLITDTPEASDSYSGTERVISKPNKVQALKAVVYMQ